MKKRTSWMLSVALATTALMGVGASTASATTTTASNVEHTYLVVFKQAHKLPDNFQALIEQAGGKTKRVLHHVGAVQVVSSNPAFSDTIRKASEVQDVGVENHLYPEAPVEREAFTPAAGATAANDLYTQYQWDIKQVNGNGAAWSLPGGTGQSANGQDIVIGVIDTGIDYTHPDIKANYAYGKSFVPGISSPMDQDGHGTHVAGSIAANGRVLGVGPNLKVAAYRVFGPTGGASTADIAAALMTAADDNVDVVNMSLGGYDWLQDPQYATKDVVADIRLFNRAIQYAVQKGVTVVGSAGNAAQDITSPGRNSRDLNDGNGATHRSPSSQLLIRTSSGGQELNLAYYSNYGVGKIDVIAPGGDFGTAWLATGDRTLRDGNKRCLSTVPGGYAWYIGTSMAAPKTAGLAGLIIAQHGKDALSPAQVKHIIQSSATDLFKPGYDGESGFGLINAVNALN